VAPEGRTEAAAGPLATAVWEALGSSVVLRLTDPAALAGARGAVEAELGAVEEACSRFRADSELSRLNEAGGRRVQVSPLLLEAVELSLRAARLTDGVLDPTIGRALELAGYDRDFRLLQPPCGEPETTPRITARLSPGWKALRVDRGGSAITIPRGVRIDLGATAKAWAADRAAAAAALAAGCGVLVSLGGDIATAGQAPTRGWLIRVTDDHRSPASAPGQTVSIGSGAIATSSTAVRRWSSAGRTMHHIIDPATGEPARTPWRTVSCAAATCADANIASTAGLLYGERAPEWLAGMGLPARLVDLRGTVTRTAGWPAEEPGGATALRSAA
jgi:thiamine biosynthesis lipoprotein ApbE